MRNLGTITANDGIKLANFRVLRKNRYPAVLVECGFVSNRAEAARCATADFREALADQDRAGDYCGAAGEGRAAAGRLRGRR